MVNYAIPAAILAMSIGAMGASDMKGTKAGKIGKLPHDSNEAIADNSIGDAMKGSVMTSDGGEASGQKVADAWKDAMKNLKEGKNGNNGNGNGNSDNGNSSSRGQVTINGKVVVFPGSTMLDPIDTRDTSATEATGTGGPASINGCAGTTFARGSEGFNYVDGASEIDEKDPTPRQISNAFHTTDSIPNQKGASDWLWQWGQMIDHDYALGPETGAHVEIEIPEGDPFYPSSEFHYFELERTEKMTDDFGVAQQINAITSFIDAGAVYGNTNFRAEFLKTNDGTGRMKTSEHNGFTLLPLAGDDVAVQDLTARFGNDNNVDQPHSEFFVAGDARVNEHLGLIMIHTLLHKEHNYWADIIHAENPDLDEDKVFAYARTIVQSEVQHITYNEFLPLLLGEGAIPAYTGFDPEVNGAALNVGAACAYRVGHTLISPSLNFVKDGVSSVVDFGTGFWNPGVIKEHGLDPFMRGFTEQQCQAVDAHMTDALRNDLFHVDANTPPRDLYSLNIERAREHGIPNYNQLRKAYLGESAVLPSGKDIFLDESVFNPDAGQILHSLYDGPDSVDCFPGILSEATVPGSLLGETQLAILVQQFTDLRDADMYWYENRLQGQLLDQIRSTKLSHIIKRNADVPGSLDDLPDDVFIAPTSKTSK